MKANSGPRAIAPYPPPHRVRPKQESSSNLKRWFRILMASFLFCASLAGGSVAGVLTQTFAPSEKWVKIAMKDPLTGEDKRDPDTGEVQYTLVKSDETASQLVNPLDVISPFNNLNRKVNVLLLGTDYNYLRGKRVEEQPGTRSRTDTIMLASLDPGSHQVKVLSIPRDTRVLIPGYQYDKINAAMTYGGVDLVKTTVSELTGVPIDYYMALKVDGLVNTVDILGGIRIYVEKDMHYQDDTAHLGINIHKGWKDHMNGQQAHGYIRFRHDELGDIGRVQRQQKFMHAVLEKLLQPESWLKFPALLQHLNENIETDIPQDVIGQMIKFGTSLKKDDLHMAMLPGTFWSPGGISYWAMDPALARNVITELFPESSLSSTPDTLLGAPTPDASANPYTRYRVTVWNGTDDYQVGREVVRRLRDSGFNVVSVYKAPSGAPKTRFIAQTGKSEYLQNLVNAVGFSSGESITASIGDIASDFTVLIEDDLANYLHKSMTAADWTRAQRAPLPSNPGSARRTAAAPAAPVAATPVPAALPPRHSRYPAAQPSQTTDQPAATQADEPPVSRQNVSEPPAQAPAADSPPATAPVTQAPPQTAPPAAPRTHTPGRVTPQAPAAPAQPAAPSGEGRPHDPLYD